MNKYAIKKTIMILTAIIQFIKRPDWIPIYVETIFVLLMMVLSLQ